MQEASAQFEAAIEGDIVWGAPRLAADWAVDGYAGTIDDLTSDSGNDYTVAHSMDDGIPEAVSSSLGGEPAGSLEAEITGRRVGDREMDGRQYYSPFNSSSPVVSYARDVAPVKLDQVLVTSNGEEAVRIFTGQMTNVLIRGRQAELRATSQTRFKLAKAVRPPIVEGRAHGAEGSWLVSCILYECGVELAPPPDTRGLQFYAPGHGSIRPFVPYPEGNATYTNLDYVDGTGSASEARPEFVDGPHYRAVNSKVIQGNGKGIGYSKMMTRFTKEAWGKPFLAQQTPRARLEFYVRGDAGDPAITGPGGKYISYFRYAAPNSQALIDMRITADRELVFLVDDGAGISPERVVATGLVLPADGEWHSVGWYYDFSNNEFRGRVDGNEVNIAASPAFVLTNLPEWDYMLLNGVPTGPEFYCLLPYAEVQFYTDVYSDPVDYGWNDRLTRTAGAQTALENWEDTTYNVTWSGQWARASDFAYAGVWSLKSSAIGHYGISAFQVTVPATSREVNFRLRLSTELDNDYFQLLAPYLYHAFGTVVANGWGAPDIGPATSWTVIGTASWYSSNGSVGTQSLSTVSTERLVYYDTLSDDGDITADVAFGVGTATGDVIRIRVSGRGTGNDGNNRIFAQVELGTDGNVRFALQKHELAVAKTLAGPVVLGSNGAGSTWRVSLFWNGNRVRGTAYNVTTPNAATTLNAEINGLPTGMRVYLTAVRTAANTNSVTATFDNVLVNARLLYAGSGVLNAWSLVTASIPADAGKLLFRYIKGQSGVGGNDAVWIDELQFRAAPTLANSWTSQAVVRRIDLDLEAIVEERAREAWGWLAEICQSSMASMRVDELDKIRIMPPSYFMEAEQMAISDTLTTDWNAQDPDVTLDPTKIRNSVQVDFNETWVDTGNQYVLQFKTAIKIPPGTHNVELPLDVMAVFLEETLTTETSSAVTAVASRVYANTTSTGSGTYLTSTKFKGQIVGWTAGSVTVQFRNFTAAPAWIVHNFTNDLPFLSIAGRGVYFSDASSSVQGVETGRTERSLTIQAPAVQTRHDARRLAAALLVWTKSPRAEVKLRVQGDPRRQPGDLYELEDAEGTGVFGEWRALSVNHSRSGAAYTQEIALKQVLPISLWDDNSNGWDEGMWT